MKVKLTELAKKLGKTYEEMNALKNEKLVAGEWKGTGRNCWLTAEGTEKLELACKVAAAVPTVIKGTVLRGAPNPNWVYALLDGIGKKPVAIPRKLHGKLEGKPILVHAITDATGTTYRHASLTGHHY